MELAHTETVVHTCTKSWRHVASPVEELELLDGRCRGAQAEGEGGAIEPTRRGRRPRARGAGLRLGQVVWRRGADEAADADGCASRDEDGLCSAAARLVGLDHALYPLPSRVDSEASL